MKILFLLENTADAPEGGTEISSRHLASLLKRKGVVVVECAPYMKRRSPFWYTSFALLPFLILKTLLACRKERVDLIHIQGKYLVPTGVIVARLLRIPAVVTIRDYVICCPIGLCLFQQEAVHGFRVFITKEVPEFFQTYHNNDNLIIRIMRYGLLLRGWFVSKWLRWWVKRTDSVIAVSTYVSLVLKKYDVPSRVIYNCFDVSEYRNLMENVVSSQSVPRRNIVFVGKDSYGKGSDLFDSMSKKKEFSEYRFMKLTTGRWTPYEKVLRAMHDALVTVVPSRWQEPFGRVVLESIMMGTPVVSTRRGGLMEIVEDGRYGIHADPTLLSLTKALRVSINKNEQLRQTIQLDQRLLVQKFLKLPVSQHLELYQGLLDKIRTT